MIGDQLNAQIICALPVQSSPSPPRGRCPEEAIFLQKDYSLTGLSRAEMIYNKEKLLALGGVHGGIQKWKHKLEEAKEQESFPVQQ